VTLRLRADVRGDVARAAELLRGGGTVAFATETVYGLGANALDAAAVEKIFVAKQRPHWDPLIVHVASVEAAHEVVEVSALARRLAARFWPGPLTMLLPKRHVVPAAVTAGRRLAGVRMPRHAAALELLAEAGIPIAAPSANRFGHTSPTTAAHVLEDLDGRIDAVLDGGATTVGVESTVVEVGERLVIYRPGAVTAEMLREFAPVEIAPAYAPEELRRGKPESLPSPGVGMRHYAPRAMLVLVERLAGESLEAWVERMARLVKESPGTVGVMLPEEFGAVEGLVYRWGRWSEPEELAARLFAGLRELDARGATMIVAPLPEDVGMGTAVRDRLTKAAMRG